MPKPEVSVKEHTHRNLKAVDSDKLRCDLRNSELCLDPPSALENLISCYNVTLMDTLNHHAPLKSRVVTVRPRLPWFNEDHTGGKKSKT